MRSTPTNASVALGLVIAVQVIDVAVHVAVDQLEPVRVLSNTLLTGAATLAHVFPTRRAAWLAAGSAVYLALNLWFLADEGLVNPVTDRLRLPLFGFVGISLGLVAWQARVLTERR